MTSVIDGIGGRILRKLALITLAVILALAALGVASAAFYLWLLAWLPPTAALAVLAGLLLLTAAIAWWVARSGDRSAPSATAASGQVQSQAVLPDILASARRAVADDPKSAVLAAVAAGFILQARPDLDAGTLAQTLARLSRAS
ncbi:MAG: hypothetical protein JNL25_07215 [Rhodospirillaceae bacterium]|nr:hypothetical protein [Rhodospirillaceae bacterium]